MTSYSVMLLVHLSEYKAKLKHATYLHLAPEGTVRTATAPALA
jgi:hypothetical protein